MTPTSKIVTEKSPEKCLKSCPKKLNQKQHGTKLQKHTTSRKSGFCVGPQHQILVDRYAGCSVVRCPFLRRGFVIEQEGLGAF